MNTKPEKVTGGCLCGAVRYEVTAPLRGAGYCHCRMCQKASGAPVIAWTWVPLENFSYSKGEPVAYQSSLKGIRFFCGTCGSPLTARAAEAPVEMEINLATLDNPEVIKPEYHIWTSSQSSWFKIADNLPRHEEGSPSST